jgi:hypothetical protein
MEKTDNMERGSRGREGGGRGLFKNRMATPKVESKVFPETPQIYGGF